MMDPAGTVWPSLADDHPITQLRSHLPTILSSVGHSEIYGLTLSLYPSPATTFHTNFILQKFLRANANDVEKARVQLEETLKWRKEFKPLEAMREVHDWGKFGGLGYVTVLEEVKGKGAKEVVTFNVYGAVKDNQKTFGNVEEFLRWRVGLMELSLSKLSLSTSTLHIPDYGAGPDPYQCTQIHDYANLSFLRMDPHAKAASKATIGLFTKYYPETLSRKFFVNVPVVMGWVFKAATLVLSRETVEKFVVLSYGMEVVGYLGEGVPRVYGGKGEGLEVIGEELKMSEGPKEGRKGEVLGGEEVGV